MYTAWRGPLTGPTGRAGAMLGTSTYAAPVLVATTTAGNDDVELNSAARGGAASVSVASSPSPRCPDVPTDPSPLSAFAAPRSSDGNFRRMPT
ncbi:hypothetical protein DQ04_03231090 [Trypanosoma grayi]|uniref:hypothetical protein n=1 Tax=Trypanosoma grayi TaxID=71804 RepID=UPI0004F41FCC|nr:hypothetical protein DQ04_03231090 [Trypanosoma grayi]KEG10849.1 hypothetical protein DQ04_03231090 [Trypanosoma grayi]